MEPVYIVGAGKVGTALASLARQQGVALAGLWTRSAASARRATEVVGVECHSGALPDAIAGAGTVIIAVQDRALQAVAGAILDAGLLRRAPVVLHCGGAAAASQALGNLVHAAPVGTFHPLVAVAHQQQAAQAMTGAFFALEGDPDAVDRGRQLAQALGVGCFELQAADMVRYHAAAVMASNHAVAQWHDAARLLQPLGLSPQRAAEVLEPLLRSTVDNVARLGLPGALTGPARRGDAQTIGAHLEALARHAPELVPAYREAACRALAAARDCGDPDPGWDAVAAVIQSTAGPNKGK